MLSTLPWLTPIYRNNKCPILYIRLEMTSLLVICETLKGRGLKQRAHLDCQLNVTWDFTTMACGFVGAKQSLFWERCCCGNHDDKVGRNFSPTTIVDYGQEILRIHLPPPKKQKEGLICALDSGGA